MSKSAGILFYRTRDKLPEFLLVHPGGPFWKKKDDGAWTIPKGEIEAGEDPLTTAQREVFEETGIKINGPFIALSPIRQKGGKFVHAWAAELDIDPSVIRSNNFEMEWPPGSGKLKQFPEIDKAAWFAPGDAKKKINPNQVSFIEELLKALSFEP